MFAGTWLLFARSLGYDFINFDDPVYVTNNAHVRAGPTWDSIVWAFTGKSDYWHPLTWLSHMFDWRLFGADATGHRTVSVLWHATNAVLAFAVMRRLLGSWWIALFSAALFAWHPLRVESVVWVTERKDVMSGFFFLLTLLAYVRYTDNLKAGQPGRRTYALTLALFLGGLMCKPTLVTLPLVLLALDFWPLGRLATKPAPGWWQAHRCTVMEKLPFFILSAIISYVTIRMQEAHNAFSLAVPLGDR
ncbi:MAG TPA: glycosyltransferase family 39 protein, partial [Lacunisphaera sp.]|nr:glycosyltransferase family 39 protein [Lacunisphaera sp.]